MMHELTLREKVITMAAVMSALFLVALDQTIISTALGKIVEEFQSYSSLTWIVTAYLLASTVTVPIAGKLSDLFGRRIVLLVGISVFLVGSLLSGSAGSVIMLTAWRALQGVGAGIITANAFSIIADLFTLAERPRWQGIIGATFGLSSIVGPLLGGLLSDPHTIFGLTTSWRWNFWINVPIGLLSFFVIWKFAPSRKSHKEISIDYKGGIALAITIISFILSFDNTEKIFATFIEQGVSLVYIQSVLWLICLTSLIFFIGIEMRAKEPIIYLSAFKNKTFTLMLTIAMLFGGGFMGGIIYLTQFNQQVFGANATDSGLMLLPMIFGLAVTSIITGRIVSNLGRYKWPMIWGFTMTGFGMLLLSFLNADSAYIYEAFIMAVMGIGMGASMPIINLAIQNEFPQHEQGVASSMSQLFRGLGSTIGTAVLGSILAAGLTLSLGNIRQDPYVEMLAKSPSSAELFKNFDSNTALQLNNPAMKEKASSGFNSSLTNLPEAAQAPAQTAFTTAQQSFSSRVVEAFVKSLHSVFTYSALVMFLATILAFFVKEKQLKGIKAEASERMI